MNNPNSDKCGVEVSPSQTHCALMTWHQLEASPPPSPLSSHPPSLTPIIPSTLPHPHPPSLTPIIPPTLPLLISGFKRSSRRRPVQKKVCVKMNVSSALNKQLFVPCGEVLLVAVEVQRSRSRYRSLLRNKRASSFLCVTVTKGKPPQLHITKVKKIGDSFSRRSQWTVEELRQVNGINPLKVRTQTELCAIKTNAQIDSIIDCI
uniref:Exocyst complex component Sec3 PIP2-binding N-terminal domain-containing protein n=1 Tax=Knipowitschia caucasica TaxID=637954 RepID=A0AAV2KB52_KNICA